MTSFTRNSRTLAATLVLTCAFLTATASPARADITAFLGLSPTPARHAVKGLSVGAGFLVVGFEFEYASLSEDIAEQLPGLRTYAGNVLAQTPTDKVQLYGTVGAQGFRETLGAAQETHVGTNIGRGREDQVWLALCECGWTTGSSSYRARRSNDVYQRFYVGGNLKF